MSSVRRITAGDVRYEQLATRGFSRWVGSPECIYLPETTEEVIEAVAQCLKERERLAVRGGGHCAEDFVDCPEIRSVIDLSRMNDIGFDT
jgi:aclacinomycin oxidase